MVRGINELRTFFDGFIKNSPPELFEALKFLRQDIEGEAAYIVWKAEPYIKMAPLEGVVVTLHERGLRQLLGKRAGASIAQYQLLQQYRH